MAVWRLLTIEFSAPDTDEAMRFALEVHRFASKVSPDILVTPLGFPPLPATAAQPEETP